MIITLTGYRGTGKSSVAPALAAALGWNWIDADLELERRAGRTIQEIFATDGEPEFRRLERETIVDLLQRNRLVLATGGGAIMNPQTRADVIAAGPVIWLKAQVETIAARLQSDARTLAQRPSLTGQPVLEEIAALLAVREPLYRQAASLIIETDHRSIADIVSGILPQLPSSVRPPSPGPTHPSSLGESP